MDAVARHSFLRWTRSFPPQPQFLRLGKLRKTRQTDEILGRVLALVSYRFGNFPFNYETIFDELDEWSPLKLIKL